MKTKKLVTSAVLIALATILSLVKLFELPFGGTVTVASMVPIIYISYEYGMKWGLFSAFVNSILQLICGIGTGIVSRMFLPGDEQMLLWQALSICFLDYILAYFVIGFGGIFKGKFKSQTGEIVLGTVFALFLRWVAHLISGYIFYGAWAEWFFTDVTGLYGVGFMKGFCDWVMAHFSGQGLAFLYSAVYNAGYMIPETIISAILAPVIFRFLHKTK